MKKILRLCFTAVITVALICGGALTAMAGPEKANQKEKEIAIENAKKKAKAARKKMKSKSAKNKVKSSADKIEGKKHVDSEIK